MLFYKILVAFSAIIEKVSNLTLSMYDCIPWKGKQWLDTLSFRYMYIQNQNFSSAAAWTTNKTSFCESSKIKSFFVYFLRILKSLIKYLL